MINKTFITGRITSDLVMGTTKQGLSVLNFTLGYKSHVFECVAYGTKAECLMESYRRGARIMIEGELTTRAYHLPERDFNVVQIVVCHFAREADV